MPKSSKISSWWSGAMLNGDGTNGAREIIDYKSERTSKGPISKGI